MPLRKEADAAAASVFFRSGGQGQTAATVAQAAPGLQARLRPSIRFAAGPASTAAQPADRPPCRTGKTRKRRS